MKVRITKVPDKKQDSLNAKKWKHGDGGPLDKYGYDAVRAALKRLREENEYRKGGKKDEVDGKTRAEMMARYSGGAQTPFDFLVMSSSPLKAYRTWKTVPSSERDVYNGVVSPKEFFNDNPKLTNYTGIGRLPVPGDPDASVREVLQVPYYSSIHKNDFISSLFNGETPLEESGVVPITESTDIYGRILGNNYTNVTGDNFRGYLLPGNILPESSELDEMVRSGNYMQKLRNYQVQYEPQWRIGDSDYFYDAGSHQYVEVEKDGKKYYKLVDVFDTNGTHGMPVAKQMNNFIADYEIPYVVSTPWKEVGR